MENEIRVLQYVRILDSGGIEAYIFSHLRLMDRTKVNFDFLLLRDQKEFYDDELYNLGCKKHILRFRESKSKIISIYNRNKAFKKFLVEHPEYKIIHFQSIGSDGCFDIMTAKIMGVKVRIAHSHIASDYKLTGYSGVKKQLKKIIIWIRQKIIRRIVTNCATDYLACSKEAVQWMYLPSVYDKAIVAKNAIKTNQFGFSESERIRIRKQLDLENKYVIGHVGRFVYSKNHLFFLDLMTELVKRDDDVRLLLVGGGHLLEPFKNDVKARGLDKYIVFYGETTEVYSVINAFDIFAFPSHYEGLGIVAVEAQANGLKCVLSDTIPHEVKVLDSLEFISLDNKDAWCRALLKKTERDPRGVDKVKQSGYDIDECAKKMENFYIECNCNR
ncbi:MAG: glycosyltransferase family 1 protein [Erysipelotrichia bacterium]|nr:glycosyltransferase family 1 protein [Erysipelotrichia bacterium]